MMVLYSLFESLSAEEGYNIKEKESANLTLGFVRCPTFDSYLYLTTMLLTLSNEM